MSNRDFPPSAPLKVPMPPVKPTMGKRPDEDLYEMLKRRQDELRGREEDWIDRLFSWWRGADGWSLAIIALTIPVWIMWVVTVFKVFLSLECMR